MLRLNISAGPEWLTLAPSVRLFVVPLSTSVMLAARADIGAAGLPEDAGADEMSMAGAKAIARRVVLDWEGVGDADGNPVALTPEGIDALLDICWNCRSVRWRWQTHSLSTRAATSGSRPAATGLQTW